MKARESQTKQIFEYLMGGSRLTGLTASKLFGTMKLPNRIGDAETQFNQNIMRQRIKVKTRFGYTYVMEYWIEPKLIKK